jgi:O-antigen/teichoic acid export membrane protein
LVARDNPAATERRWSKQQAFGALLLRLTMVGLEFLCVVALARVFKATGYGIYAFVVALLGLLAIPTSLGLDRFLVREVARLRTIGDWATIRGLLRWSARSCIGVSLLVTVAGFVILGVFHAQLAAPVRAALAVGFITIPLTALARLRTGALQGLGHVREGLLPESVVQPGVILLLAVGALLLPAAMRGGTLAVFIYALAMLAAFVVGAALLRRAVPRGATEAVDRTRGRAWLVTALPLAWVLGMNVVLTHTDVVMLGLLSDTAQAGVYRVAAQLAALASLPLGATNLVLAPRISSAFAAGRMDTLQAEVTHASRYVLLLTLPIVAVIALAGSMLLGVFGTEFKSAAVPLTILVLPQLLNAATGTAGYLLVMTHYERQAAAIFGLAAALNVVLNLLLIPAFGMTGAAAASAFALLALNVGLAWGAWLWVRVLPSPIVWRRDHGAVNSSRPEAGS